MIVSREGFGSVEEMIQAKKQPQTKPSKKEPEDPKDSGPLKPQNDKKKDSKLPSHVTTLNDIVKLDLLKNENAEKIGEIWNGYHSTKDVISASLDSSFYEKLYSRSKEFPMVPSI